MKRFSVSFLIVIFSVIISFAINQNIALAELEMMSGDEAYKYYVLDRIDGPDIPENVKQFANENNCFEVIKHYYWSYVLFKNEGGVYSCLINGKAKYIYDYENTLRFARWYEQHKFKKLIYEF